jgi:hypothetical protein
METRRKEPKAPKPRPQEKPKRFRLVKLEQRVTPRGQGPNNVGNGLSIE